jgi:small ligand-binding sensory domain FIST
MRIVSAISSLPTQDTMLQDLEEQLKGSLQNQTPDLLLVFVSSLLADNFQDLVSKLKRRIQPKNLLALSAESVIGNDQEIERTPAVSALAMSFKGRGKSVSITTFHIAEEEWPTLLTEDEALQNRLQTDDLRAFFMAADPFTTPVVQFLDVCSRLFPTAPILGGMASGMSHAGEVRLAIDDDIFSSGLVGVSFSGNIEIDCVVSQGCRPIGPTFEITRSEKNVIEQLDGKPATVAIDEMINTLPVHDRQLLAIGGLHVGRVVDPGKGNFGKGDFLIRSLLGVKRESGAILIADVIHTGQTLQFHLRDAKSAEEDMRLLLEGEIQLAAPPAAAVLVTCNSRGTRFFDMPHHDVTLTRQILGNIPIAGFFAAGELGPIAQKNFIHGHTAALALFRQPVPA